MFTLNFIGIVILLGAIQGFILVFALSKIKDRNESANHFLKLFILLISLTMFGRVLIETQFKSNFPNFLALPDAIIFLYGPTLYFYLRKLLTQNKTASSKFYIHLTPALIFILLEAPSYVNPESYIIQEWEKYRYVRWGLAELLAWLHNMIYAIMSIQLLIRYQKNSNEYFSFKQYPPYLKVTLLLIISILIAWGYSCFSWIVGYQSIITSIGYNTVWIILPCITYILGYFAMYQPDLFKMKMSVIEEPQKIESINTEDFSSLKIQTNELMTIQKPYLDPKLNLGQLAEMLNTTPHVLSKTINSCFDKNFNDFVNSYRIEEFKKISVEVKYKNMSVLAIAFDAGFNSKTTFYTAFKKLTQETPNEYLKNQKDIEV